MSLLLWTARSISSSSSASSISLTNSRLPPTSESGASCSRSPDGLDDDDAARQARPPLRGARRRVAPATARAGCRACRAAARQPRLTFSARSREASISGGRFARRAARESTNGPLRPRVVASAARCVTAEAEQARQRLGVRGQRVLIAKRLELLGRRQQQLLDDADA